MELSSTARKLKKQEAYELTKRLHCGESLTHTETSNLLLHFAPPEPRKPKTNWDFVRGAVAKNDCRYYLNYVNVEDGIMTATDAHQLRQAPTDLVDGSYCPKTGTTIDPDVAGTFPDVSRVKPRLDVKDLMYMPDKPERRLSLKQPVTKIGNSWYRDDCFQPALDYIKDADIYQTSTGTLVIIKGDLYALIMPIKID